MFRFATPLCLLSLLLASAGCRMCLTPHDYRLTGYVERHGDYRGFHPHYRAGSIFGGYQIDGDLYHNAGDYGMTTPVVLVDRQPDPDMFREYPTDIPRQVPQNDLIIAPPRPNGAGGSPPGGVPSIQELIDRQRSTIPGNRQVIPPAIPEQPPSPFDHVPGDAIPFSPNDEVPAPFGGENIVPPSTIPNFFETDLPITLEELQRLDPSVHDLQIISIEDAGVDIRVTR